MTFCVVFLLFTCPFFVLNDKLTSNTKVGYFVFIAVVAVLGVLYKVLLS